MAQIDYKNKRIIWDKDDFLAGINYQSSNGQAGGKEVGIVCCRLGHCTEQVNHEIEAVFKKNIKIVDHKLS